MSIEYPDLADFLAIAESVTGIETDILIRSTTLDLADSALHAPQGGWGDQEFYPDFVDKAAVLLVRLAKNHPLLDGNKRAAWVTLRLFVEINGWAWVPYPGIDEAEQTVLAVASSAWDEEKTAEWLRGLLQPPTDRV